MNLSQDWKAKLKSAYSLTVQNCKNTVWGGFAQNNCRWNTTTMGTLISDETSKLVATAVIALLLFLSQLLSLPHHNGTKPFLKLPLFCQFYGWFQLGVPSSWNKSSFQLFHTFYSQLMSVPKISIPSEVVYYYWAWYSYFCNRLY